MDDAVEKAEIINAIVNAVGESGKGTTWISIISSMPVKWKRGRERGAQNLMVHTAIEESIDKVLLSELYIKLQTAAWFQYGKGKADIHITNINLQLEEIGKANRNFVAAEVAGIPFTVMIDCRETQSKKPKCFLCPTWIQLKELCFKNVGALRPGLHT
uniref:Uncharacterized protein n=1 Tax=Glossina pallidipes TaxID=7398 RepID=A0A1A9ZTW9_GLOPL